ncbi:hypothetical protein [Amycolatopsis tolypomycina]|uniref:hypothetical protein n=1 Tax=Amycolatopsis tolypomycina TaxID=208445 RepID=UPI0033AACC8A
MTAAAVHRRPGTHWWTRLCTAVLTAAAPRPASPAGLGWDDLMPELGERMALLARAAGRQAVVTVDRGFTPHECPACAPRGRRITSVRLWGAPRADVVQPLQVAAVCLQCALGIPATGHVGKRGGLVQRVLDEARPGAAIRIEVCE